MQVIDEKISEIGNRVVLAEYFTDIFLAHEFIIRGYMVFFTYGNKEFSYESGCNMQYKRCLQKKIYA